jgi:hypothetical protein
MVSVHKPGENGPSLLVPRKERPSVENCGQEASDEEIRRMLTPFAERLAGLASEVVHLEYVDQLHLLDDLLVVLPRLV